MPWFNYGVLCGFVAQSLIFCVVVYGPLLIFLFACLSLYCYVTARRGHDRMVGGFTTTYAISAYHHWWSWVRNSIRARCTTWWDEVCQWLATDRWFSPGPSVSSTNKTDRHDIAEMLLNTIKQTNKQTNRLLRYLIYIFGIFQRFSVGRYECLMPLSSTSHQRPKARVVFAQIKWR